MRDDSPLVSLSDISTRKTFDIDQSNENLHQLPEMAHLHKTHIHNILFRPQFIKTIQLNALKLTSTRYYKRI